MNVFNKESLRSFLTQIAFKNFVTDIDYTETSTAKQVLGNCERMVLANFVENMLSTFIL